MKKLIFSFAAMLLLTAAVSKAQNPIPNCTNSNALEAKIDAIEAGGWVEQSRSYTPINYLIEPDAPYLAGYIDVTFSPDCAPLEPCPEILKLYRAEVYVQESGNCTIKL